MVWGSIIAWYLFLAGVSAGAYCTAVWVGWKFPQSVTIQRAGYYVAPPLMAVGLLLLMIDAEAGLFHPWRFLYLYTKPDSMMSIGTYIISIFMLITLYQAYLTFQGKKAPGWLTGVGLLFAFGTAAYTGLLIGVVKAVPLWNTSILPVLFTVSALSTGIAITVLLATLMDKNACSQLISLKKIHFGLMILEVILIFIMLYITSAANETAFQSVMSLLAGEWSLWFWIGLIVVGLLIPLLLEGLELFHSRALLVTPSGVEVTASGTVSSHFALTIATEGFVLIGGYLLRFLVLAAGTFVSLF
ncbi:MAG: polysulfide reductase NrfD [Thermicanus sp.]|nr:polysulfide reductase NrfD [Thermicanus sp.]